MWWPLLFIGLVGLTFVLSVSHAVWRRRPVGERDQRVALLLFAGTVVVIVGLAALVATAFR